MKLPFDPNAEPIANDPPYKPVDVGNPLKRQKKTKLVYNPLTDELIEVEDRL